MRNRLYCFMQLKYSFVWTQSSYQYYYDNGHGTYRTEGDTTHSFIIEGLLIRYCMALNLCHSAMHFVTFDVVSSRCKILKSLRQRLSSPSCNCLPDAAYFRDLAARGDIKLYHRWSGCLRRLNCEDFRQLIYRANISLESLLDVVIHPVFFSGDLTFHIVIVGDTQYITFADTSLRSRRA